MSDETTARRFCACGAVGWKGPGSSWGHRDDACHIEGAGWVPRATFEKPARELVVIAGAEMAKVKALEEARAAADARTDHLTEQLSHAFEDLEVQRAAVRALAAVVARSTP